MHMYPGLVRLPQAEIQEIQGEWRNTELKYRNTGVQEYSNTQVYKYIDTQYSEHI